MNLRSVDLNLLVVLEALIEERGVRRAGERIGLSQSATSHALDRLRKLLGDEILVRTTTGMEPTARALSLVGPLQQVSAGPMPMFVLIGCASIVAAIAIASLAARPTPTREAAGLHVHG